MQHKTPEEAHGRWASSKHVPPVASRVGFRSPSLTALSLPSHRLTERRGADPRTGECRVSPRQQLRGGPAAALRGDRLSARR